MDSFLTMHAHAFTHTAGSLSRRAANVNPNAMPNAMFDDDDTYMGVFVVVVVWVCG